MVDLRVPRPRFDGDRLTSDLRTALDVGRLRLAYQPIVGALDGKVRGVEALLRWMHPEYGNLPPDLVVPLAERAGLIHEIGIWVLEQTCSDAASWRDADGEPLDVSVNISPLQLACGDVAGAAAALFRRTGFRPERVTFELTESALLDDDGRAAFVLEDLRSMGVRVALDDFGTGYSSLGYLKQLPIDVVKIDRMFVADLHCDRSSRMIVDAVTDLAHGMGMTVVAEGIETAAQLRAVRLPGCDACQGFLFSRPLWAHEVKLALAAGISGIPAR